MQPRARHLAAFAVVAGAVGLGGCGAAGAPLPRMWQSVSLEPEIGFVLLDDGTGAVPGSSAAEFVLFGGPIGDEDGIEVLDEQMGP